MANFVKWESYPPVNLDNVFCIESIFDLNEYKVRFVSSSDSYIDWTFDSEQVRNEALNYVLSGEVKQVKKEKSKPRNLHPKNIHEEFERLWVAKGRKGSKQKALTIFKSKYCLGEKEEDVKAFVDMLISNIERRNLTEMGAPEQHLTSYLNGRFWES